VSSDTPNFSNTFSGRQKELATLQSFLNHTKDGQGKFVVITGESGLGKTSLVNRFVQVHHEDDITILSETFDNVRNFEPYLPFYRLIEKLESSTAANRLSEKMCFNRKQDSLNIECLYSLQSQHGLMQQRILAPFLSAAKQHTLVVILNNVHLAPLSSWKFIHYLSENLKENRILIIATIRQDGRETRGEHIPAYADVLQRMNREGLVCKMHLPRLSESEIRHLLFSIFPRKDFTSQFFKWVSDISGGNPSLIKKLLIRCLETNTIFQHKDVWFNRQDITKETLIKLIRDECDVEKVTKLLKKLPDTQKTLLQFAVLMHTPFDHNILSTVTKRSRLKIIKDLIFLKNEKILYEFEPEKYQFKQTALQTLIRETITEKEREAKHRKIAENIKSSEHLNATEKIFDLAYHYNQTHDYHSAFVYLRRASEISMENFAFLEAKNFLKQALALQEKLEQEKNSAELIQMLIWACWLDRILGHWEESITYSKAALELLVQDHDVRLRNQILIQQGFTYFRLNDQKNAKDCFEKCLKEKQNLGQIDEAMATYGLGNVYFELIEYEKSYKYFEKALNLAQNLQDKQLMANVFNNLGALENIHSHRMKAIALYSKSIPLFKSLGDNFGLARIYHNIGMTHADENNWQQANDFYGQSLIVSDVMGLVPLKSITFLNRAMALANLGKLNEAREYNFKAYRLLEQLSDDLGIAEYHKIQGVIEHQEGNWSEASKHFKEAIDKFKAYKNKLGIAESCYEFALLSAELQHKKEAGELFSQALEIYKELQVQEKVDLISEHLKNIELKNQPESQSVEIIESTNER